MNEVGHHLLSMAFWMVVVGILGVFVFPHEAWVFLGLFGAVLMVALFVWWVLHFSLSGWLADVIRRSRRPR